MLRFATLSACLFLASACGSEGGPVVRNCTSNADCMTGMTCVDSRCVEQTDAGEDPRDANSPDTAMMCTMGDRPCGETCCTGAEVCDGVACCETEALCGGSCCGDGRECVADRCLLACEAEETRCGDGDEATCCGGEDVCYLGACTTPGAVCTSGRDCEEGSYCEPAVGRCLPRDTSGEACEYMPDLAEFELREEWSWLGDADVLPAHNQVMHAPMVANLTDDNDDGVIDENDIPDVVFTTFSSSRYNDNGIVRAISGDDGHRLWPTSDPSYRARPSAQIAIADVTDSSPGPEVITCTGGRDRVETGHPLILSAAGTVLHQLDALNCSSLTPAVADIDGDGTAEILIAPHVLHGDGTVVATLPYHSGTPTLANMDDDPDLEIVYGNAVLNLDGTYLWNRSADVPNGGSPAIADLDLDGDPEIAYVHMQTHTLYVLDGPTGADLWSRDVNPPEVAGRIAAQMMARPDRNAATGGGPPTIANFDDDPNPEIALAGGYAYIIFDSDGERLWFTESRDISSRSTGSSIFDFEGDGVAEVLYNDELEFRVFRGHDGTVFHSQCNTSGTLQEYPLVVDVDNDDHAEIVLMENSYAFRCDTPSQGIHVFGHPAGQWVRTRRIWNQHTYHVTNINEDGTVPARETTNWTTERLNNFRQNVQPDGLLDAPDLQLVDLSIGKSGCPETLALSVRVINRGRASAPAGVPVTFYDVRGDSRVIVGRGMTSRPLLPGESEVVTMTPDFEIPDGEEETLFEFDATVNAPDDMPLEGVNECRTENNDAGEVSDACLILG